MNNRIKIKFIIPISDDTYKPHKILLAQPLPESVTANTPFDVHLKMVNKYGDTITSSFNSGLEIMAQVSFTHKWFERIGGLWLAQTDAVLAGPDVITSVTNDKVIFKRFLKGVVRNFFKFLFFLIFSSV